MEWVLAAVAVLTLGLAALAAAGQLGSLPASDDDTYRPDLPVGDLTSSQLRATRFGVAIRGYDMAQVDALLNRLADQLEGDRAPLADPERFDDDVELPGQPPQIPAPAFAADQPNTDSAPAFGRDAE